MVKNLPTVQETWVRSLGWEDPLEKEMATYFSILACTIPWTEKIGGLQSMGSQRVGHDWLTLSLSPKQLEPLYKGSCLIDTAAGLSKEFNSKRMEHWFKDETHTHAHTSHTWGLEAGNELSWVVSWTVGFHQHSVHWDFPGALGLESPRKWNESLREQWKFQIVVLNDLYQCRPESFNRMLYAPCGHYNFISSSDISLF